MDTGGLLLAIVVHAANVQDRDGAKRLLAKLTFDFGRLKLLWADGGYAGKLAGWCRDACAWTLEIVKRPKDQVGFEVLPRPWVVERTFAWLGKCRRPSKDYEFTTASSEAFVNVAVIHLMLKRLG